MARRKTWKELKRRVDVGRDQVARVMRGHGLVGKPPGSKKRTTSRTKQAPSVPREGLQHDFIATRLNEKGPSVE